MDFIWLSPRIIQTTDSLESNPRGALKYLDAYFGVQSPPGIARGSLIQSDGSKSNFAAKVQRTVRRYSNPMKIFRRALKYSVQAEFNGLGTAEFSHATEGRN